MKKFEEINTCDKCKTKKNVHMSIETFYFDLSFLGANKRRLQNICIYVCLSCKHTWEVTERDYEYLKKMHESKP